MTVPLLGFLSGDSMILKSNSGTIFKRIAAGSETWLANAGWLWMLWLIPLAFLGWFFMNNIKTEAVSPDIKNPLISIARIAWLLIIAFVIASIQSSCPMIFLFITFGSFFNLSSSDFERFVTGTPVVIESTF